MKSFYNLHYVCLNFYWTKPRLMDEILHHIVFPSFKSLMHKFHVRCHEKNKTYFVVLCQLCYGILHCYQFKCLQLHFIKYLSPYNDKWCFYTGKASSTLVNWRLAAISGECRRRPYSHRIWCGEYMYIYIYIYR